MAGGLVDRGFRRRNVLFCCHVACAFCLVAKQGQGVQGQGMIRRAAIRFVGRNGESDGLPLLGRRGRCAGALGLNGGANSAERSVSPSVSPPRPGIPREHPARREHEQRSLAKAQNVLGDRAATASLPVLPDKHLPNAIVGSLVPPWDN